MRSPTFSFFATARPYGPSPPSKRHRLGGAGNAGRQLLQRVAEVDRVRRELLQRLLRIEALIFDDLPFGFVDLTETIVTLEVGREDTEDDPVGHYDVCDVLKRTALGFRNAHCFLERGVSEYHNHPGRVAAVAPLAALDG